MYFDYWNVCSFFNGGSVVTTFAVWGLSVLYYLIRAGLVCMEYWGFLLTATLLVLPPYHGSIKASAWTQFSFLNSFTRSAYHKVFSVCSQHVSVGEIFAIITVLHFPPMKESFKTWVSLLPLNGVCFLS